MTYIFRAALIQAALLANRCVAPTRLVGLGWSAALIFRPCTTYQPATPLHLDLRHVALGWGLAIRLRPLASLQAALAGIQALS